MSNDNQRNSDFDLNQTMAFNPASQADPNGNKMDQAMAFDESATPVPGQAIDFSQTMTYDDPTHSMRQARYQQEKQSLHFKPGTKLDTGVYKPTNAMSGPMADTMVPSSDTTFMCLARRISSLTAPRPSLVTSPTVRHPGIGLRWVR